MDKPQRATPVLNSIVACSMTAHALDKRNRKRAQQTSAARKIPPATKSGVPTRGR